MIGPKVRELARREEIKFTEAVSALKQLKDSQETRKLVNKMLVRRALESDKGKIKKRNRIIDIKSRT